MHLSEDAGATAGLAFIIWHSIYRRMVGAVQAGAGAPRIKAPGSCPMFASEAFPTSEVDEVVSDLSRKDKALAFSCAEDCWSSYGLSTHTKSPQ